MNGTAAAEPVKDKSTVKRGVIRWLVREIMGTVMAAVILFVSVGTWKWTAAWILVGIYIAWIAATALAVIPTHPELLGERTGPKKGTKTWDVALLGVLGVVEIAKYVLAGLDVRWGWSPEIPTGLQAVGAAVAALGYALLVWATSANAFFAQTVRIQSERGHAVVTGGPYRFVRHPGYVGGILFYLATPVLLGSWWALTLGAVGVIIMVIRTSLEDRVLQEELAGYAEYARQTRYRLLPGIW